MDLCGGFELITDRLRHRHISAGWLSTPQVCVWSWGGVATLIARIFNDPEAVLEGNQIRALSSADPFLPVPFDPRTDLLQEEPSEAETGGRRGGDQPGRDPPHG